jgi:hypothetical protein
MAVDVLHQVEAEVSAVVDLAAEAEEDKTLQYFIPMLC